MAKMQIRVELGPNDNRGAVARFVRQLLGEEGRDLMELSTDREGTLTHTSTRNTLLVGGDYVSNFEIRFP